jgi:heme exporter protein B|tara:strand:- start:477 stop:1133 length:657 start_codon:yes stop_codon:yes gene_type:complete
MIALLQRDLILAIRAGGGFGLGMAFFLMVVVLVPLGIGPDMVILAKVSVGILWVGALLACVLSLDRIFSLDYDDGTLELLVTSPIPLEAVVAVKAFSHWITTGLPLVIISPILGLFLGLQAGDLKWLFASLFLGTPALSAIGAFGAALTVGIRRGGLLLSLIVLPLYIPTLVFGSIVARTGVAGLSNNSAMLILTAITLVAFSILPFASAVVLRINLR